MRVAKPRGCSGGEQRRHRPRGVGRVWAVVLLLAAACASGGGEAQPGPDKVIDLPGAGRPTNFDDLTYSSRLGRVLVPALDSGLYLVDPESGEATRFEGLGTVSSVTEGDGMVLIADRRRSTVSAVDPLSGRVLASAPTAAPPDYVRYVSARREIWVTQKGGRPGIEIFGLAIPPQPMLLPRAFISIPEEPEGLTIDASRDRAYTHSSDGRVLAIDMDQRTVVGRWAIGCRETHGIPALDERRGLLLAGCASDGKAALLDVNDGRRLDTYSVEGDEALMAHSPGGHFHLRADPGTTIATLEATPEGELRLVRKWATPKAGHCLMAEGSGYLWTCDQRESKLLRYTDR